jgi:hypothetical protein
MFLTGPAEDTAAASLPWHRLETKKWIRLEAFGSHSIARQVPSAIEAESFSVSLKSLRRFVPSRQCPILVGQQSPPNREGEVRQWKPLAPWRAWRPHAGSSRG